MTGRTPRLLVLRSAEQIGIVTHPLRLEIVEALQLYGPDSIAGLARRLDRRANALTYHVRRLEQAGAVVRAGTRRAGRRDEAVYAVAAPRIALAAGVTSRPPPPSNAPRASPITGWRDHPVGTGAGGSGPSEEPDMDRMQAEQTALSQLDAGEYLLWSGAPDPGRQALHALPAMLFGIPFTAFAAFWMTMAFRMTSAGSHPAGPGPFFALFGLPFLLIGLAILTSPLWTYLGALRTVYAVTDHRALIITGLGTRGVQSFTHTDIGDLQRFERADGSGDLYFAARGYVTRGVARVQRLGFIGIPEVRTVEQLIRSHLQSEAA